MTKAYSYTRMSTPDQQKGDSKRRQVEMARAYAQRHDLEIVERYDDLGVSAFHGANAALGALSRFIGAVDDGTVEPGSVLIVESIDRLSRQAVSYALTLLMELIKKGITVVTLAPEQVYSEETIEKELHLIGALFVMARAHEESKIKAMRGREAWKAKRARARASGQVATRRVPAWLYLEDGVLKVHEGRAKIVQEIFALARDGWGAFSIARALNQRDEKPWGTRPNAVWRDSYIKKILHSRTVLGEYQPHQVHMVEGKQQRVPDGDPVEGYYPAIIDVPLFHDVGRGLSIRRSVGAGRKGAKYANLFTGLLRCWCGAGYRYVYKGTPPKGGEYLQCSVALSKGSCSMSPIRYRIMETLLLDAVDSIDARKILDPSTMSKRAVDARSRRAQLIDSRGQAARRVANYADAIGDDGKSRELLDRLAKQEAHLQHLDAELASVEREIADLNVGEVSQRKAALSELLVDIRAGGDDAVGKRRALAGELRSLVEKVVVHPSMHVAEEIASGGVLSPLGEDDGEAAETDWKSKYGVKSIAGLRKLLRERCFEVHIIYRTGASERFDALTGPTFKVTSSLRMKEMRMVNG
ncbi:recombinase family protein [Montanilutibacter psychrotolerans]|nr:recombinase family protein [Lysobacter psychrotolerans]